jgi:phosphoserine phosphatase
MYQLIFHSNNSDIANQIEKDFEIKSIKHDGHFRFNLTSENKVNLQSLREKYLEDFNLVDQSFRFEDIGLMVSDMDSTMISIECIDEIADFANLKAQVSEITEQAMQGILDFNSSLKKRVALLKGLDLSVLNEVYIDRLKTNPGAELLINFLNNQNIKTALVSGGFTYFTDRLAKDTGIDFSRANVLEVENGHLSGKTSGRVINSSEKANFVKELCQDLNLNLSQTLTIGDGANDLDMMNLSGFSVAYHAKPVVIERANACICYGGLDKIIDFFTNKPFS